MTYLRRLSFGALICGSWLAGIGCGSDTSPAPTGTDAGTDKPAASDTGAVEMGETMPMDGQQEAVTPVQLVVDATEVMLTENSPTNGMQTFTVGLDRPWSTPITISLISGNPNVALVSPETLEFDVGQRAPQTVVVRAVADDNIVDDSTTITISSPETGSKTVKIDVKDTDVQAVLFSPPSVSMTEGGQTETVSVRLYKIPASAVVVTATSSDPTKLTIAPTTLTFNSSNYSIEQALTLTAPKDMDAVNDKVTVNLSATGGIPPQQVPVAITDVDAINLAVIPGSLTIGEKDPQGDRYYVNLTQPPPSAVTVAVQVSNANKATADPSMLTFDATNWNSAQAVTVKGVPDADGRDENLTVTFTASGITPAPEPKSVSLLVKDPDSQALQISPSVVMVGEGQTTSFTVNLTVMPDNPVTLAVFSQNNSKIQVTPPLLSFTPQSYLVPQTVSVVSLQDDDLTDDTINVTLSGLSGQPINVPVTVKDDDHQVIQLVLPSPGDTLTMTESLRTGPPSTAPVGVRLGFRPAAPVTVTIAGATAKLTLSTSTLTFNPAEYATAQFVTLTAPVDQDTVNDEVDLSFSSTGVPTVTLPVKILDEDTENFVLDQTSLGPLNEGKQGNVAEGSATFTVKLRVAPASPVTASITSNKPTKVSTDVASCMLDKNNYTTGCVVTVTAVEDADTRDEAAIVTVADMAATNPIDPQTVGVTVHDLDVQSLIIVDQPQPVGEGKSGTFTVKLAADPVDMVSINVFSQRPDKVQVTPPVISFSTANFDMPQTVTLAAQPDDDVADETVTVTLTSLVTANVSVTATVIDDDVQSVILVPTPPGSPLLINEGNTSPLGVRLAFRPAGTVTVNLTAARSPDSLAAGVNLQIAPAMVTFGPGNGIGNFATTQFVTLNAVPEPDAVDELDIVSGNAIATNDGDKAKGIMAASQLVKIIDKDVLNFDISAAPKDPIPEGSTAMFNLGLTADPPAPVTPTFTSGNSVKATAALVNPACTLTSKSSTCQVKITTVHDKDARDDMVKVTVSDAAAKVPSQDIGVTIHDLDTQALLIVAANPVVVTEDGVAASFFTVALAADPIDPVTVNLSVTPPTLAGQILFNAAAPDGTPAASFQFTTTGGANPWNVPHTFEIHGVPDLDLVEQNLSIQVTLVGATGVADAFINVRKLDDDTQGLIIREPPCGLETERSADQPPPADNFVTVNSAWTPPSQVIQVMENQSRVLCVSLQFKPDVPNTVTLTPTQIPQPLNYTAAPTNFTVTPQTPLMFGIGTYFRSQPVTIFGSPDTNLDTDPGTLTISVTPLAPAKTLNLEIADKDAQHLKVQIGGGGVVDVAPPPSAPTIGTIMLSEDGSQTVYIGLTNPPLKNLSTDTSSSETITVAALSSSSKITLGGPIGSRAGGGGIQFDLSNASFDLVPITITAVHDDDANDEMLTLSITSSHPKTPTGQISIAVKDLDTQDIIFNRLTAGKILIGEGNSDTVGIRLNANPISDFTVTCTADVNMKVSITDSGSYTFTSGMSNTWNLFQSIHLQANHDADTSDDMSTITCSGGGLTRTFTVVNVDSGP